MVGFPSSFHYLLLMLNDKSFFFQLVSYFLSVTLKIVGNVCLFVVLEQL